MNMKLGGQIGYLLLKCLCKQPGSVTQIDAAPTGLHGAAKLERFLGRDVWQQFAGRRVLDFGCGHGAEAIAVAQRGAVCVYGIDIQEHRLDAARQAAASAGVADRCIFLNSAIQVDDVAELEGTIDCAYSIDSFEHYARPDLILDRLHSLLRPGGELLISFGPPWNNPYGCHMRYFCRWPWIHLLFREETIMTVRAAYRNDGARRFEDVDGGLNRMTLKRFLSLMDNSSFELDYFNPVPLSARFAHRTAHWCRLLNKPWLREFTTSVVQCRWRKPDCDSLPQEAEAELTAAV